MSSNLMGTAGMCLQSFYVTCEQCFEHVMEINQSTRDVQIRDGDDMESQRCKMHGVS